MRVTVGVASCVKLVFYEVLASPTSIMKLHTTLGFFVFGISIVKIAYFVSIIYSLFQ